jgi:GcrA cell cycle regulator
MRGVAWTEHRLGLLKQLWADGKTATAIGRRLGISKSAVLGKVYRLRLAPAADAAAPQTLPDRHRRGRPQLADRLASELPEPKRGLTVFELTNATCRWPHGQVGSTNFHFCGAAEADLDGGRPYCERHALRAYRPNTKAFKPDQGARSLDIALKISSPPTVPKAGWQQWTTSNARARRFWARKI